MLRNFPRAFFCRQ
jgi:hypothetical protein